MPASLAPSRHDNVVVARIRAGMAACWGDVCSILRDAESHKEDDGYYEATNPFRLKDSDMPPFKRRVSDWIGQCREALCAEEDEVWDYPAWLDLLIGNRPLPGRAKSPARAMAYTLDTGRVAPNTDLWTEVSLGLYAYTLREDLEEGGGIRAWMSAVGEMLSEASRGMGRRDSRLAGAIARRAREVAAGAKAERAGAISGVAWPRHESQAARRDQPGVGGLLFRRDRDDIPGVLSWTYEGGRWLSGGSGNTRFGFGFATMDTKRLAVRLEAQRVYEGANELAVQELNMSCQRCVEEWLALAAYADRCAEAWATWERHGTGRSP